MKIPKMCSSLLYKVIYCSLIYLIIRLLIIYIQFGSFSGSGPLLKAHQMNVRSERRKNKVLLHIFVQIIKVSLGYYGLTLTYQLFVYD